jgi:hypothetical protein
MSFGDALTVQSREIDWDQLAEMICFGGHLPWEDCIPEQGGGATARPTTCLIRSRAYCSSVLIIFLTVSLEACFYDLLFLSRLLWIWLRWDVCGCITLLRFRHVLGAKIQALLDFVNGYLRAQGAMMAERAIVDATLIRSLAKTSKKGERPWTWIRRRYGRRRTTPPIMAPKRWPRS